jgi:hypothetical protein
VLREISINGMTNTMLDEHEGVEGDHGEHLIKHKVSFGAGDRVGIENSDPVVLESAKESGGGEVATELTASEGETECVPVAVGFLLFILKLVFTYTLLFKRRTKRLRTRATTSRMTILSSMRLKWRK